MLVFGFFSNSFVTCHKEIWFFLQYCLSQWVTATKNCFVCRTEPLRQTYFLFTALSHYDKQSLYMFRQNLKKGPKMLHFMYFLRVLKLFVTFWHFVSPFLYSFFLILRFLAFCVQNIPILFVAVTQCDKQEIHLSQWLSATNKTNLCHSDSVRQTILKKKSNLFLACNKGIGKKAKNKHPFKFEFHHRYQITLGYQVQVNSGKFR